MPASANRSVYLIERYWLPVAVMDQAASMSVVTKMVVVADEVIRQPLARGHPLRVAILWAAVRRATRPCGGSVANAVL